MKYLLYIVIVILPLSCLNKLIVESNDRQIEINSNTMDLIVTSFIQKSDAETGELSEPFISKTKHSVILLNKSTPPFFNDLTKKFNFFKKYDSVSFSFFVLDDKNHITESGYDEINYGLKNDILIKDVHLYKDEVIFGLKNEFLYKK